MALFSIQKAVPGLARFLGAETQGLLRLSAENIVQPVIEIDDYLGPNQLQLTRFNVTALGDEALFEVPANRFWRAKWIGSYYAPGAGNSAQIRLILRVAEGDSINHKVYLDSALGSFNPTDAVAGVDSGKGLKLEALNLRPGDKIGYEVAAKNGAGAWDLDVFLQYQELEI